MSKYKLDLQLFAEGDGDGAGDGSGAGAEGNQNNNNEKPVSFDEFLNQGENRAEFDSEPRKQFRWQYQMLKQSGKLLRMIRYRRQKSLLK